MLRSARRIFALAILLAATSVLADAERGGGFWVPRTPETEIRAEPADGAKAVARLPLGGRVHWREKKGEWLHLEVAAIDGWAHATDVSEHAPGAVPGKRILLDRNAKGFETRTADTSAARGFDRRAEDFARSFDTGGRSFLLGADESVQQLVAITRAVGVRFRDPAADGRTPDSAGVIARRGFYEDTHIAKGRLDAAAAFALPGVAPDIAGAGSKKLKWWKAFSVDASGKGPETKELDRVREGLKPMKRFSDATEAYRAALDAISGSDARALGASATLKLVAQTPGGVMLDDEDLALYVNDVANFVALTDRPRTRVDGHPRSLARRFFVIVLNDDAHATAFSAPGGWILVTRGLLERLDSESELAFVLAHEIAHVDHEDGLDAMKAATGVPEFAESFFQMKDNTLAKFFLDQKVFSGVAERAFDALVAHAGFWGRKEELAADASGLDHVVRAGYDGAGALRVLSVLAETPGAAASDDASHDSASKRREILAANVKPGGATGYERYQREVIAHIAR